jgi:hypothetical protein
MYLYNIFFIIINIRKSQKGLKNKYLPAIPFLRWKKELPFILIIVSVVWIVLNFIFTSDEMNVGFFFRHFNIRFQMQHI